VIWKRFRATPTDGVEKEWIYRISRRYRYSDRYLAFNLEVETHLVASYLSRGKTKGEVLEDPLKETESRK